MGAKDSNRELGVVFNVPVPRMAFFMCSLPACGMLVSVALSVIYDFEESTATHCRVKNYLPSISAAIGGFTPQRYIWRICIALHCAPRFMVAFAYYNHYMSFTVAKNHSTYILLCRTLSVLHLIENMCLVCLSMISSTENFELHEFSFIGFLVTSQFYMLITLVLHKWSRSTKVVQSPKDKKSFKIKLAFWVANLAAIFTATYLYFRHNAYCEPGVYTLFASFEYFIVITNILFHGTFSLDLDIGGGKLVWLTEPFEHYKVKSS